MTVRRRFKLSEQQRNDMWRRWKAGQSLHEIGRAFSKDHVSIQFMLAQHGGIAPAVRRRSPLTLTLAEREEISRGIASGGSIREIARGLQRAVSTVSREVGRARGGPPGAGDLCIEPVTLIRKLGSRPCGPSAVFLPCT
jgi:DNA-binding CsgD family transcriptional regulator